MLVKLLQAVCGANHDTTDENHFNNITNRKKIRGTVVLMKKNVMDLTDVGASFLDRVHEVFGKGVSLQLISADHTEPGNGSKGKLGKPAFLEKWMSTLTSISAGDATFNVTFEWGESMGVPGAFIIKNYHHSQFYLRTVILEDVPGHGQLHFVCNSWVYPVHRYKYNRVFFFKQDPNSETRLPPLGLNIYVPRDERFTHVKLSDFLAYAVKSLGQVLIPEFFALFNKTIHEFDSFEDILKLYEGGFKLPDHHLNKLRQCIPWEMLKELVRSDGEPFLKFPMPDVIKVDRSAWRTDEEFGREMLAGVNPVIIRRLQEFPPASKLDPEVYGNQTSSITREHIEKNMDGPTVDEAIKYNKLFILDHHDALMPYLRRINTTNTKTYASRTLLLLQDNGTLLPLAIELSLPHPQGDKHGATSFVFTPADEGVEGTVWQLAKAYAAVNDSGYHQLISHWLNTHAVIEPFVIATNRHLSVLHPIYKLLQPHFRDTMYINALARQILINAGGILELTVFPGKYAMEMSSIVYKNWVFTEQGLLADLLKRGVAVPDSSQPYGLKLLIEDYPYAVDGLEIWAAIEAWVDDYCSFYYSTDDMIRDDTELQSWWTEVRNEGHGDLKDEPWWPEMQSRAELVKACTIIIWVASALHAAVNFGQYPYAGYLPNRPTVSRRFMPEPGTAEYAELESNPDLAFLKTITAQFQTLLGVSLIEILSRHSSDEIYLGQRENPEWTSDIQPRQAFQRFHDRLVDAENRIVERNNDSRWKNRNGPVKVPYMLLYPNASGDNSESGLTGKGIPNSVSI
ncbi:unnamed protein product [Withania somnifera]